MKGVDLAPFRVTGPAVVANSGGKTSGYNLWLHLEANGGTLTDAGRCVFTNTGWEHPATLDFLAEQERRWGVGVAWLEFEWRRATADELAALKDKADRAAERLEGFALAPASYFARRAAGGGSLFEPDDDQSRKEAAVRRAGAHRLAAYFSWRKAELVGLPSYRRVTRAAASTDGRPYEEFLEGLYRFRALVKGEPGLLPNGVQRLCTGHLKMRPSARFARDTWGVGVGGYECRLGLRADEQERIAAAYRTKSREAGRPVFPLDDAGVGKADVAAFWAGQPFGLSLRAFEGNCGGCYMKRREALVNLIRRDFFDAGWWEGWEARTGQRFRAERSYRGLRAAARTELSLLPIDDLDNAITCESGYCSN